MSNSRLQLKASFSFWWQLERSSYTSSLGSENSLVTRTHSTRMFRSERDGSLKHHNGCGKSGRTLVGAVKLTIVRVSAYHDLPQSCQRPQRHMEQMEARAHYRVIPLFPAQTLRGLPFAVAGTTSWLYECCARASRLGRYIRNDFDKLSHVVDMPREVLVEDQEGL